MSVDLTAELPPAQRLALAYAPAFARPATLALLALDARLGAVLRGRREPLAAQLRLAWWRDRLATRQSEWPPGEPLLEALRCWRAPAGLGALVDGWEALLAEALTPPLIGEFVDGRAQAFAALARELGSDRASDAEVAARTWAFADLAANVSSEAERGTVLEYARNVPPPPRLSSSLRPLAVLADLGAAALRRGGGPLLAGPRSALAALRIGLTGR
jgi:phytoene synthase